MTENDFSKVENKVFAAGLESRDSVIHNKVEEKELWTTDYLIYRLKEHLATVPISASHKTDYIEDRYASGHENKVIDARKYYNQAYHYLKFGYLKPAPKFLISLSELSPKLVLELAQLQKDDRKYILKQAVALIFQEINNELFHHSVSRVLEVQFVE